MSQHGQARRLPPADCPRACLPDTSGRIGAISFMMSLRPPYAPTGNPPPITLPSVVRSGLMPYSCCAPPKATRKPVMTSSKISSAPVLCECSRSASQEARRRRHATHVAHDRFDNNRRDVVRHAHRTPLHSRHVIKWQRQCGVAEAPSEHPVSPEAQVSRCRCPPSPAANPRVRGSSRRT